MLVPTMKITKSLLSNAVANYLGVAYTTLVGMVVFPMYLQYLGPEAFGLVGFFTVLQAWMQLLDLGMSPMLSRQVAHARGVDVGYLELQKLLRSLEVIFFAFSLIVMLSVALRSTWIASNWLNIESLDLQKVANCIVFMGGAIGLRLFASLYRSGIRGAENQVWLNIANVMLATFKTMGALLLLKYITQEFVHFFIFQLFIAVAELITLAAMFYSSMPFSGRVGISFHWGVLKPTLPFCGGVAYTAAIWVLLTQLDKLLLSSILPLSEYGYFTLVAVVAAGIVTLSGPISQAILPRMTYLLSRGEEKKMLALYRKATQFMAVIMFPLTGMVALFSNELLYAWTGDRKAAEWAGPILFWFALGNGILVVGAFQYYLQFAHGKLRMHVIYNTVSACVQIPVVVWAAFAYGAFGTAVAWFVLRLVAFLIWSPIVHSKFAPGIYWPWLLKDIAPFLFCTVALLTVISKIGVDFGGMGRAAVLVSFGGIGLIVLALNVVVSGACRDTIVSIFRKKAN